MSVLSRLALASHTRQRALGSVVVALLAIASSTCRGQSDGSGAPIAGSGAADAPAAAAPGPAPSGGARQSEGGEPASQSAAPREASRGPAPIGPAANRPARRDLSVDEERGGHTLERHVGKTDEELRARLARERQISAASTYVDLGTAEVTVAIALTQQARRVRAWQDRRGPRPNLALDYDGPSTTSIGRMLRRGARMPEACDDAVVVLRWDNRREDFYVLTSYPERRR